MTEITTRLADLPLSVLIPGIIAFLLILRRAAQYLPEKRINGVPLPPFVPDWIPFIGNALLLAKGDAAWASLQKQYGPAFRVRAMGDLRTFVCSPERIPLLHPVITSTDWRRRGIYPATIAEPQLISYVYKQSKNFDFFHIRKHMAVVCFGMDSSDSYDPVWDDTIFPAHHRNMQVGALKETIHRYVDKMEQLVQVKAEELCQGQDGSKQTVDLYEFIVPLMYEASSTAFFSPLFPAAETMVDFWAFDQFFPILNLEQLPSLARQPARKAMHKMRDRLAVWYREQGKAVRHQMAPAMQCMLEAADDREWSDAMIGGLFLSELWALEANAPIMGFWTITNIMRDPSLASRIRSEISSATASLSPPTLGTLYRLSPPDLVAALPLTNAAFQESLRLYTESFSIRVVQKDLVIPGSLCTGGPAEKTGFALKKGEQVICNTRVGAVEDAAWGRRGGDWNADRMLKDGKKGSMAPFGGGVSMCEGRHFASAEILAFIAIFMSSFDIAITGDTIIPELTRVGLGTRHPLGKLMGTMKLAKMT